MFSHCGFDLGPGHIHFLIKKNILHSFCRLSFRALMLIFIEILVFVHENCKFWTFFSLSVDPEALTFDLTSFQLLAYKRTLYTLPFDERITTPPLLVLDISSKLHLGCSTLTFDLDISIRMILFYLIGNL